VKQLLIVVASVLAGILLFAGLASAQAPETVKVTITEWKVELSTDTVPAGIPVKFTITNTGNVTHEVVLERAGALESLSLPHQSTLASAAPAPALPAQLPTAGDIQILDRMKKLIEKDPGVIGDVMRPQPVFAEGKQRGYRVYPGRNRAAFARLGLRPGDLVTSINGTPLDDPARGNEIFRTLGSSAEARVTVMRSGRQQELTLNMAQVANEAEQLAAPPAQPDPAAAALGGGETITPEPAESPPEERGD